METLNSPLNKAQIEILKLLSRVSSEEELMDIKRLITRYYAERLMNRVDQIWEDRGYTQDDLERIANSPS